MLTTHTTTYHSTLPPLSQYTHEYKCTSLKQPSKSPKSEFMHACIYAPTHRKLIPSAVSHPSQSVRHTNKLATRTVRPRMDRYKHSSVPAMVRFINMWTTLKNWIIYLFWLLLSASLLLLFFTVLLLLFFTILITFITSQRKAVAEWLEARGHKQWFACCAFESPTISDFQVIAHWPKITHMTSLRPRTTNQFRF